MNLGTFPRNQHALGFRRVHSKVIARYPVSNGIDISLKVVKINGGVDGLVKKDVISIQQYLTATICMYRHGTYPGLLRGGCPTHSLLTTHAHYIREGFVGAR